MSSGSQLDFHPVVVSFSTRTTRLPAIPGVDSRSGEDQIRGLAIAIVTCLDNLGAAGERSEIQDRLFIREDG